MAEETEKKSGERVFLHDLSNLLLVAQGMGSFSLTSMEKKAEHFEEKEINRMKKTLNAIDRMIELVKDRRVVVKAAEAAALAEGKPPAVDSGGSIGNGN